MKLKLVCAEINNKWSRNFSVWSKISLVLIRISGLASSFLHSQPNSSWSHVYSAATRVLLL